MLIHQQKTSSAKTEFLFSLFCTKNLRTSGVLNSYRFYLINWECKTTGKESIILCCQNNLKKLSYIVAIKDMIEATGKKFNEAEPNKWEWYYPFDMNYIETLEDFIKHEKPMIDKYLRAHLESGIPLADIEINDKYVKELPGYLDYIADILIQKKIGDVDAVKAECTMTLNHNRLSNEMVKYLKCKGYTDVVTDKEFVDIQATGSQGNKIYFELKATDTVKLAIRQALGQLLEYNHYPNKNNADKLIIVTELEITQQDIQYLLGMRSRYNNTIKTLDEAIGGGVDSKDWEQYEECLHDM